MHDAEYKKSLENKEEFWKKQGNELVWTKKFDTVLDEKDKYM